MDLLGTLVGDLDHCVSSCGWLHDFPKYSAGGRRPERPAAIFYARRRVLSSEEIKQRIEAAIPGSTAEVEDYTGGSDHFRATVTAEAFAGLSRVEQHRLVYGALEGE